MSASLICDAPSEPASPITASTSWLSGMAQSAASVEAQLFRGARSG